MGEDVRLVEDGMRGAGEKLSDGRLGDGRLRDGVNEVLGRALHLGVGEKGEGEGLDGFVELLVLQR